MFWGKRNEKQKSGHNRVFCSQVERFDALTLGMRCNVDPPMNPSSSENVILCVFGSPLYLSVTSYQRLPRQLKEERRQKKNLTQELICSAKHVLS
jgi:hypothetical protein